MLSEALDKRIERVLKDEMDQIRALQGNGFVFTGFHTVDAGNVAYLIWMRDPENTESPHIGLDDWVTLMVFSFGHSYWTLYREGKRAASRWDRVEGLLRGKGGRK